MHIRPATPADTATLFDIRCSVSENHLSRDELARLGVTSQTVADLLAGDGPGWIAELEGVGVGFSMVILSEQTVFACFIRPGYEGRGIGRRLMEAAEACLAAHGIEEAWLSTGADPAIRANGFYQHLGWRPDGHLPDGQILYRKRLTPL